MANGTNTTHFRVTGGFEVDASMTPVKVCGGEIAAFMLPDGRYARLVVGLEIEDPEESAPAKAFRYVTNEREMADLGFECLDYGETTFFLPGQEPERRAHLEVGPRGPVGCLGQFTERFGAMETAVATRVTPEALLAPLRAAHGNQQVVGLEHLRAFAQVLKSEVEASGEPKVTSITFDWIDGLYIWMSFEPDADGPLDRDNYVGDDRVFGHWLMTEAGAPEEGELTVES